VADPNEYITYAERCLAIARTISSREYRIVLREMAAEWTKLASALDSNKARNSRQNRPQLAALVIGNSRGFIPR
jgi:hypothetical protein